MSDATEYAAFAWQVTLDAELQLDVTHAASERNDECVNSQFAKFRPVTVTDA